MNLKMNRSFVLVAAVLAVMVTGSVATADYIRTTADGNGADSYVNNGDADANFGHENSLSSKSGRMAYVKFDISTWNDNATVTSATFELTWAYLSWGQAETGTLRVYALDSDIGDGWGEDTITWSNAPGNDTGEANGVIADDTTWVCEFNWTAVPDDGDKVSATITVDSRLAFINDSLGDGGDDLVTFIVNFKESTGDSTNVNFASKEYTPSGGGSPGDWAPKLTLVPEPATMSLLVLGGVGLLLRRRRR